MKKQNRKIAAVMLSIILIISACSGLVLYRAGSCMELADEAGLFAGRLSFVNGSVPGAGRAADSTEESPEEPTLSPVQKPLADNADAPTETAERPKNITHSGDSYPVEEIMVDNGNMSYENITVRNTTDYSLDPETILNSALPFTLEDNHSVQVLIYHTHTCESYMTEDSGVYYDDYYPRSTDPEQSVVAVGDKLVEALKAQGIGAVHDTTLHDYPSYEGSYARSWETVSAYKEKYPSIKVTIDLHRDAMTSQDGTKYKPTFEHDGEKAAQIMIMSGYDTEGDFDFWDENLIFAMRLQKKCEDMYPGMTRPLNFGEYTYNMNFNNGSLLIEVGTDGSTVDEACRSGEYLGTALGALLLDNYS